jgi:hypothetical protein
MVVRRRKGSCGCDGPGETVIDASSISPEMLKNIEMHMRGVAREEKSRSRYLQRHLQARETSPSLSGTVSSAVHEMTIEDG